MGEMGFTVTVVVAEHPSGSNTVIHAVPGVIPRMIPVAGPMLTSPLQLVHVPPLTASDRFMLLPTHTLLGPVMGASALTVTTVAVAQPVGNE